MKIISRKDYAERIDAWPISLQTKKPGNVNLATCA